MLAHVVPVVLAQLHEDAGRQHGDATQDEKRLVDPLDELTLAQEWKRSGMKQAVTRDAVATPKLRDICWAVLAAMVLAMLVSAGATSA